VARDVLPPLREGLHNAEATMTPERIDQIRELAVAMAEIHVAASLLRGLASRPAEAIDEYGEEYVKAYLDADERYTTALATEMRRRSQSDAQTQEIKPKIEYALVADSTGRVGQRRFPDLESLAKEMTVVPRSDISPCAVVSDGSQEGPRPLTREEETKLAAIQEVQRGEDMG
jgi:hypothetical protein